MTPGNAAPVFLCDSQMLYSKYMYTLFTGCGKGMSVMVRYKVFDLRTPMVGDKDVTL